MKPVDLKDLIKGVLSLILFALAIGKFGDLKDFARREAASALRVSRSKAFFPESYDVGMASKRR